MRRCKNSSHEVCPGGLHLFLQADFGKVYWNCRMLLLILLMTALQNKLSVSTNESWISAQLTERLKTYDRRVRPFADKSRLNVSMQLGVIGLGPIDSVSLTLRIDVYFRHWWEDERLDFGNNQFTFNGDPSQMIWVPDTFGYNSVKTEQHKTLTANVRTKLGPYGAVYLSTRLTLISFCKMNLANYPFDEQTCGIQFESYSYTGKEVYLSWKDRNNPIEYIPDHVQLSGYEVVTASGRRSDIIYQNGEIYPALLAEIRLRRTFTYHLFSGYMPSIFLVVLTWATFWIPADAVPARVTLIVTNFLSTIFVIQQELGKIVRVDYTTAMQILLITNLVFVSLAMVEYLVVLNITSKKKDKELTVIANGLAQAIALENIGEARDKQDNTNDEANEDRQNKKKFSTEEAHIVDYYCRIGVPIVYITFLSAYIGYYKSQTS